MLVSFQEMPDTSRLWIYQAERSLTPDEIVYVEKVFESFVHDWTAHGSELKASFKIENNQFLTIILDESNSASSGCSIDASVGIIRALGDKLGISFLNNDKVAFLIDGEVELFPIKNLRENVQKGVLSPDTIIFNNTVKTLAEYKESWRIASQETWMKRYFN